MKDNLFLPDRLKAVASHLKKCKTLCDIGTDHAYIPIYAVKNNLADFSYACDIVDGPLKIAKENIAQYGLSDKIDVVKSDGLTNAPQSEIFVIAGMGGTLIGEILEASPEKAKNAEYLVLQPMSCAYELRRKLHSLGFMIINESIAKDSGKLYNIIVAKEGNQSFDTEIEYHLGRHATEKKDPLLGEFLAHKINVLNKRIHNMKNSDNEKVIAEIKELKALVKDYRIVGETNGYSL